MSIHNGWRYPPPSNLVEVLQCLEEALLLNHKLVEPLLVGLLSLATTGLGVWRQVRQKVAEGRQGRGRLCVEMSPCFSRGILHSSQWHLVVDGRCYSMYILSLLQRMALDRFLQRCIAVYSKLHQLQLLVGRMFLALGKMADSTYLHLPPSPFLNTASELRSVRANRAARPRQGGGGRGEVGSRVSGCGL